MKTQTKDDHNTERPKAPTQAERVLAYLRTGRRLTQIEALSVLGVMRLASRITDLKQAGHLITREMVEVTNRFGDKCVVASYALAEGKQLEVGESGELFAQKHVPAGWRRTNIADGVAA